MESIGHKIAANSVWRWPLLVAILLFGFASKVYRLDEPKDFYFDEVYHAFSATQMLEGNKDVYDPWATSPPGVAFEWTHPPLAKLLMAGGMAVAGRNSFGWRIGSAIAGTGVVWLTALFALELFASWPIALLAAAFLSFEGLSFSMARIGMSDAYFTFFALLSLLSYAKWAKAKSALQLVFSAATLGLALSCKWTALYVWAAIMIDLFTKCSWKKREWPAKRPWQAALLFTSLPLVIYLFSYAQFFWLGGNWEKFCGLQAQMWWYHSGLAVGHAYQSRPWEWLLNLRPVWFAALPSDPGFTANIYAFGNSVVLCFGLIAIVWPLKRSRSQSWEWKYLLLCYFSLWMPWIFSPRIMFFYHYAPAVPFLCIILAHRIAMLAGKARVGAGTAAIAAAFLWFAVSYPHLTGLTVTQQWADNVYFAFSRWK